MTCDDLRTIAPDLALDETTGAERAEALAHLAACDECRALVADLASIADEVLLLSPSVEPTPGFESRVLARISPARAPRSRRVLVAAAIAVAMLASGLAGFAAARSSDDRTMPVAAAITTSSGRQAGIVVLASDPDRMTCVFDDARFRGLYRVEIGLDDGSSRDVGSFDVTSSPWSWTVDLDVDAADVREVRVLDGDGTLRASASID